MQNFVFQSGTRFEFGTHAEEQVGRLAKQYGKRLLLHYGSGHIMKNQLYDRVVLACKEQGIHCVELGGVKANPELSLVRRGIQLCQEEKIDFILAVGGGSVIDSAKAIAAGAVCETDIWDLFLGKGEVSKALPIGVILTIPATGSEASPTTVLTREEGHVKRAMSGDCLKPVFALMNPKLTYTLPCYQTAAGGVDIMSHVFERYFTREKGVDLTDRLCEAVIRSVIHNLPLALAQPENYEARAQIMWAGTIAHNGLLGTGRTEDWASHMMAHEISGLYDMTHGATLAMIIPQWMEYVYQQDVARFARYAVEIFGVEADFMNPEACARKGIEKTKEFFKKVGMPITFKEAGLDAPDLEQMAEKCLLYGPIGGFVQLTKDDVTRIYQNCL